MKKHLKDIKWVAWRSVSVNAILPFSLCGLVLADQLTGFMSDICLPGGMTTFFLAMFCVIGLPLWMLAPAFGRFIHREWGRGIRCLLTMVVSLLVNYLVIVIEFYFIDCILPRLMKGPAS